MPLRIGFDMDGVLADFSQAFRNVETRLFGADSAIRAGEAAREEEQQQAHARRAEQSRLGPAGGMPDHAELQDYERETAAERDGSRGRTDSPLESRRRRDLVWQSIHSTSNFWRTLQPVDPDAVRRIHDLAQRHRWEVFFITQRPATEGDTVQRQTQQWLVEQGFDLPSVLVLGGSRGAAAAALRLDYLVDDRAQNCLDVLADSRTRPILIVPDDDPATVTSARKLGVGTARSIGECLDILTKATEAQTQPALLQRLATLVGWR
jgi:hypothetical protein